MKTHLALLVFLVICGSAWARNPAPFRIGGYADTDRELTCVTGPAGTVFHHVLWAYVPDSLGLVYLTVRLKFPANLDLSRRPVFNDRVFEVIYSDYPGGTLEWNMLFNECPSGWIQAFSHEIVLLDETPGAIEILGAHSMMRDCTFVLNDVAVVNSLGLNTPDCPPVPVAPTRWDHLKSLYLR